MSDSQFSIKLPTSVQYPKTWINSTFSLSTRDSHSTQFILDCTSNNLPPECITVFIVFIHNCLPCQDCYIVRYNCRNQRIFVWCTLWLVTGPGVSDVMMTCMIWQYIVIVIVTLVNIMCICPVNMLFQITELIVTMVQWLLITVTVIFSKQNLNLLP